MKALLLTALLTAQAPPAPTTTSTSSIEHRLARSLVTTHKDLEDCVVIAEDLDTRWKRAESENARLREDLAGVDEGFGAGTMVLVILMGVVAGVGVGIGTGVALSR